jgi:hypothetical protein
MNTKNELNVSVRRKVVQCCESYEMDPETKECLPRCAMPCENEGSCVEPEVCKCQYAYEGAHCEIGKLSRKF